MESVHHIHHKPTYRQQAKMKVTGLILISLGLVALAQARPDYLLKCAPEEMGIRWPSYKSKGEYYACHRVGDKPMVISCKPGEVFTFVLQICSSPSRYIPAPELSILPTASPVSGISYSKHEVIKPLEITNSAHPPMLTIASQQVPPQAVPQVMHADIPQPPMISVTDADKKEVKEAVKEKEMETVSAESVKPAAVLPPMPPTPAPTPPVVDIKVEETAAKAPVSHAKKPTAEKKKSSAKPGKSEKKKPSSDAKAGKKTPKKPSKTSKATKKPTTSAKKSPKAPKA